MLKLTQPNNQLCSPTCIFVFECSHQNIYLSILLNEQGDFISACLNMYQNITSFIAIEIEKKKTVLNELNERECSKTPSKMSSYAYKHVFLHMHAQTNINRLLY